MGTAFRATAVNGWLAAWEEASEHTCGPIEAMAERVRVHSLGTVFVFSRARR
jgi:hypothetical protein